MWGKLHRICKKFSKFAPNIQLKYVFIMALLIVETPVRIFLQTCKEVRLFFAHTFVTIHC